MLSDIWILLLKLKEIDTFSKKMLRKHDISRHCSCSLLSSSENNNYYQFFMFLGLALIFVCMKNATMQKHSSTLEEEKLPKPLVRLAKKPLTVGCLY